LKYSEWSAFGGFAEARIAGKRYAVDRGIRESRAPSNSFNAP
jgi:hypothetical protein